MRSIIVILTALGIGLALIRCSEAYKKEEALDEKGICRVDGTFKLDCNTCRCTIGKPPGCTKIGCNPSPREPVCVKPRCSGPDGVCLAIFDPVCGFKVQFETFINSCQLGGIGCRQGYRYFSDGECNSTPPPCRQSTTQRLTSPIKEPIPLITKENAVGQDGICRLNASFPDDCNSCSCTEGSFPKCTLIACQPKEPCILPPCAVGIYYRCSDLYEPVCAVKVEFRTFSNTCELGGQGCRDGFSYFRHGRCDNMTAAID